MVILAAALQVVGLVLVVLGVWMLTGPAVGVVAVGVAVGLFGWVLERAVGEG